MLVFPQLTTLIVFRLKIFTFNQLDSSHLFINYFCAFLNKCSRLQTTDSLYCENYPACSGCLLEPTACPITCPWWKHWQLWMFVI